MSDPGGRRRLCKPVLKFFKKFMISSWPTPEHDLFLVQLFKDVFLGSCSAPLAYNPTRQKVWMRVSDEWKIHNIDYWLEILIFYEPRKINPNPCTWRGMRKKGYCDLCFSQLFLETSPSVHLSTLFMLWIQIAEPTITPDGLTREQEARGGPASALPRQKTSRCPHLWGDDLVSRTTKLSETDWNQGLN